MVIGGANSNNTQELFDICSKNCKHSYRLIDVKNFDYKKIKSKIVLIVRKDFVDLSIEEKKVEIIKMFNKFNSRQ